MCKVRCLFASLGKTKRELKEANMGLGSTTVPEGRVKVRKRVNEGKKIERKR
jgi:hypothetical protein